MKPFILLSGRPMHRKREKRFDVGQYQKQLKKMKEDNIQALVREKVDKENEVVELRKKTEKLRHEIAYRKRKVGVRRCSDGGACNIYE